MKVLNLYAGIGGNRKLWSNDNEYTAIEIDPKIAKIYKDFYPNDEVIITDAHEYLLKHFSEFDFIWSSPPCPSHSRLNFLNNAQYGMKKYPDLKLYEEILFLKYWFKGKYCVENVISYYAPLVKPYEIDKHYFWSNFFIPPYSDTTTRGVIHDKGNYEYRCKMLNIDISKYTGINKIRLINNCVEPKLAKYIWNCAFKGKQTNLKNP